MSASMPFSGPCARQGQVRPRRGSRGVAGPLSPVCNFLYDSVDDQGAANPIPRGAAILIRWDEVAYAEFIEA